jgi:hypothetical protein
VIINARAGAKVAVEKPDLSRPFARDTHLAVIISILEETGFL